MITNNKYESYRGDWIISFRCEFSDDGKHRWYYITDESTSSLDWTAQKCLTLDEEQTPRVDLKSRADAIIRLFKQSDRKRKNKLGKSFDIPFQDIKSFIPEGEATKEIKDKALSIVLNHIVSSQSSKPLLNIISTHSDRRMLELRGLEEGQPCWFFSKNTSDNGDYLMPFWKQSFANFALGFPDLFFCLENKIIKERDWAKDIIPLLNCYRQKTTISVLKYELSHSYCELQLHFIATLCKYIRSEICNCLPIAGPSRLTTKEQELEPIIVDSPEVVITSKNVEDALINLSDIWQDKASAVLVSAPPGSGKENFALSIPYGSGRRGKSVPTLSLANGTPEQQEELLMGYQQKDGSIVEGLLATSKNFAIFIDEAHYPLENPGVRPKLLRALEAKEYYPIGGMELRKVENVQWLFASSLPLDGGDQSLGKCKPDDFWTRMSHLIRIDHPLENIPQKGPNLEDILQDFFKFFWWDRIKSHFAVDPALVLSQNQKLENLTANNITSQLKHGFIFILLAEMPLNTLANIFSTELLTIIGENSLHTVSIRGLRSMVSRIFARCVGEVTTNSGGDFSKIFCGPHDDAFPKKEGNLNAREYLRKVIKEIQQIAQLKP